MPTRRIAWHRGMSCRAVAGNPGTGAGPGRAAGRPGRGNGGAGCTLHKRPRAVRARRWREPGSQAPAGRRGGATGVRQARCLSGSLHRRSFSVGRILRSPTPRQPPPGRPCWRAGNVSRPTVPWVIPGNATCKSGSSAPGHWPGSGAMRASIKTAYTNGCCAPPGSVTGP